MPSLQHQYGITLTAPQGCFSGIPGTGPLSAAVLIDSPENGCCGLIFTVSAPSPASALEYATRALQYAGVPIPDGASLSVLAHEREPAAA